MLRATALVAEQAQPSMEAVFSDDGSLGRQQNEPCHTEKLVQELSEEHNKFKVLTCPPTSPDLSPITYL